MAKVPIFSPVLLISPGFWFWYSFSAIPNPSILRVMFYSVAWSHINLNSSPLTSILIASMDPKTSKFGLSHRPSPGGLCVVLCTSGVCSVCSVLYTPYKLHI